jgi:ribosomal protein L7/L12
LTIEAVSKVDRVLELLREMTMVEIRDLYQALRTPKSEVEITSEQDSETQDPTVQVILLRYERPNQTLTVHVLMEHLGVSNPQARALLIGLPKVLGEAIEVTSALDLKNALEAVGARVEVS